MDDRLTPLPFHLRLAGLGVEIGGVGAGGAARLPSGYRPFLDSGPKDLELVLGAEDRRPEGAAPAFQCPPIWTLHRTFSASVFSIYPGYPELRATLAIPAAGDAARLDLAGADAEPFRGPAMELLMISRLAAREGAVLHACGVDAGGRGILFAGESGAGKSTLSRLWALKPGIVLLSDDRVIVRRQNGRFVLHGTPWHGEARFGAPGGVPLEQVYFIRHGKRNAVKRSRPAASVAALLKRSFPPFWSADGMAAALDLFTRLAAEVPCAELFFVPDESAVEYIGGGR